MSRLRYSKYRHVYTDGPKPEGTFTNIVSHPGGGDHAGIYCNTKYWAVGVKGGGGPFVVHPFDKPGVVPTDVVKINGHTSDVLDMDFHPFYQDLLLTGSVDCKLNLWKIPEGGPVEGMKPISTITGNKKKVMYTLFNPVADNIVATADGSKTVNIFDVSTAQHVFTNKDHKKLIQDLKWAPDGSQLCTASKDRSLRFFDPRAPEEIIQVEDVHKGLKTFKMSYLSNHNQYITVGFNRQARRELKTYDGRTHKVLTSHTLDQSAGVLFPHYDHGTNLLYLVGRGDSNIRIFERVTDAPYEYECSNVRVSNATRGICVVPKRCLDVLKTETTRFVKMETNQIHTLSYTIPRRDGGFQDELFPDDYAGIPALTSELWIGGQDAQPVLMSLDPDNRTDDASTAQFVQKAAPSNDDPEAAQKAGEKRNAFLEKKIAEANKKIKELEARERELNGLIAKAKKAKEESEVAAGMEEVNLPEADLDDDVEETKDDSGEWSAEEESPAPAASVPAGCKNPELYTFLASDAVQMPHLYEQFVDGGLTSIDDLKDADIDEFVEDFGLKKAQARKIIKALAN